MSQKTVVFVDYDLDGLGSVLTWSWCTGTSFNDFEIVPTKVTNAREDVLKWLQKNSFENYDRVLFLDLDVTGLRDIIDHKNVTIYDHHTSNKSEFNNAKAVIHDTTSTCRLIYDHFDDVKLSAKQIEFIGYVNDYDNYTLKFPESYKLNVLLWIFNGDRAGKFLERFKDGFTGFSRGEDVAIQSHINTVERYFNGLAFYEDTLTIQKKKYRFLSTFADRHINEIADKSFKLFPEHDAIVIVNIANKRVYLRKSRARNVDLDLSWFAELVCDGGGHDCASGGFITKVFLEMSKKFKPIQP